ncbi:ATP-binding protein [Flavobacterium sp. LS2P90]|uniref:histidine kinase n=1 Tax=Flavobacterium xylosi TaxID=3230415 RepID=A0ABW6HTW8_9FLAO
MKTLKNDYEIERVKALMEFDIMDTLPEKIFDDITKIASSICNTPISIINFIDQERQYFKSSLGLTSGPPAPLEYSFCAHAIASPQAHFEVTDARDNPIFASNPLVTGDPNIVFYYGIPLVTTEGFALGSLCVIDHKPGKLSEAQSEALQSLSNQVMFLLDLRKKNKLLVSYQQKLQEYSSNMEAFAAMAAHDLKQPLGSVQAALKIMKVKHEDLWDDTDQTYFKLINNTTRRMNLLINDLLDYAKGGFITKEYESIDVNLLITSIFEELTENNDGEKPEINIAAMPLIKSSRTALTVLLKNIMSNALKYQKKGIRTHLNVKLEKSKSFWTFSVQDNGIGIKTEYLETIFEPFKRLHNQEEFDGSGLGLASCKKIVEKLNGEIWATSELNKGTTVYFTIKQNKL